MINWKILIEFIEIYDSMSMCLYVKKLCKHTNQTCPFIRQKKSINNCALRYFLKTIKNYQKRYKKADLNLIYMFKKKYVNKWNKYKDSAKGRATGKAFEDFILELLVNRGKINKKSLRLNKRVQVINGVKYPFDIVYEEKDSVKALLELKINLDIQHAMAFVGLLELMDYKIALVTFYEPSYDVNKLLSYIQNKYNNFKYFSIIKKPNDVVNDLIEFIR